VIGRTLVDGGHRGLQAWTYYFYVFLRFYVFSKSKTFKVFCRVSYVFSNYARHTQ